MRIKKIRKTSKARVKRHSINENLDKKTSHLRVDRQNNKENQDDNNLRKTKKDFPFAQNKKTKENSIMFIYQFALPLIVATLYEEASTACLCFWG